MSQHVAVVCRHCPSRAPIRGGDTSPVLSVHAEPGQPPRPGLALRTFSLNQVRPLVRSLVGQVLSALQVPGPAWWERPGVRVDREWASQSSQREGPGTTPVSESQDKTIAQTLSWETPGRERGRGWDVWRTCVVGGGEGDRGVLKEMLPLQYPLPPAAQGLLRALGPGESGGPGRALGPFQGNREQSQRDGRVTGHTGHSHRTRTRGGRGGTW